MITYQLHEEIKPEGLFIGTVAEVLPSVTYLANTTLHLQNVVIQHINNTNIQSRKQELVLNAASPDKAPVNRALTSVYREVKDPDTFVEVITESWYRALNNAQHYVASLKIGQAAIMDKIVEFLGVSARSFAETDQFVDQIHREYTQADDDARCEVVGAMVHPSGTPAESFVYGALVGALSFRHTDSGLVYIDDIETDIKNGNMDAPLFNFAIRDNSLEGKTPALRNVARYASIAVSAVLARDDIGDRIMKKSLAAGLSELSGASKTELVGLRAIAHQNIQSEIDKNVKNGMVPYRNLGLEAVLALLENAVENHIYSLIKGNIAREERPQVDKRRSKIKSDIAVIEGTGIVPEVKSINRQVGILQGTADSTISFDEIKVKEFLSNYASRYPHDEGLSDGIEQALTYLQTADFGKGIVRGVKGMKFSIKVNGGASTVFQFKPSDVAEIRGGSQLSATRILFTLDHNCSVALLSIFDRKDANSIQQNYGLGSKRRG